MAELLGFCAGLLTTAAFVPQVVKTWRSRSSDDLSMAMLVAFATGVLLWIVYGVERGALAIVASNVVTFGLTVVLLILKVRGGRASDV